MFWSKHSCTGAIIRKCKLSTPIVSKKWKTSVWLEIFHFLGQNWTKLECLKCWFIYFFFTFQFFQPSSCKTKWRGRCSKWNPISQRDFIRYWGKVCLFNLQWRDEKLSSNAWHQSFDKRLEIEEKTTSNP